MKSQEVWRTRIFFRGLRWKPACKLIETDSPDFQGHAGAEICFFLFTSLASWKLFVNLLHAKMMVHNSGLVNYYMFCSAVYIANDVFKTSRCNFRSPSIFSVVFCETWIQPLQVYHELLQLQDLQRQLQQMDNTAAQAWSFRGMTTERWPHSTKGHDERWYKYFSKGSRVSDFWWLYIEVIYSVYIYKWF